MKKQKVPLKNMAILGILLLATTLVFGVTVNGLSTSQELNKLSSKIFQNNQVIYELEDSVQLLGRIESSRVSLDIVEKLSNLEDQIKRLKEENEKLEDQMDKVKENIQRVYALFPIGPY